MDTIGFGDALALIAVVMGWMALERTRTLGWQLHLARKRLAALEAAAKSAPPAVESLAAATVMTEPPVIASEPDPIPPPAPPAAAPPPASGGFTTEWLAGRGLVWVGALALGLAGLFMIRYSMENGLFGPLARVISGLLLGAGLIAAGDWLARRMPSSDPVAAGAMPPVSSQTALIGSGVCTLFTASYGAYAFYGLIGPLPAFVLLSLIAFAALLMALRHGPIIALIGLVGALAVPALVAGQENPAPLELFLYLAAVVATCLAVVRYRGWWWLGWVALAGAMLWTLLWLAGSPADGDTLVTGAFAFLVLMLLPVGLHLADTPSGEPREAGDWRAPPPLALTLAAAAGALLVLFIDVRLEEYGTAALLWLGIAGVFSQWTALRRPGLIALPWMAATTAVLAYLAWLFPLPRDTGWIGVIDGRAAGHAPVQALIEPAFMPYTTTGLLLALLFGLGGWLGAQRTARPWSWSLLSVLVPLLVLIIAYGHTASSSIAPPWATAALGLAALLLTATSTLHRRLEHAPALAVAVATYAAGVTAAVTLAMVMVLHDFWLTVAISLQLPALAWIERRTRVTEMRVIALALVVTVLIRLVLNPGISGYEIGGTPILNGLLYGYGLPLAAFRLAQVMFRANRLGEETPAATASLLVDLLEAGWIACLTLLVSLQLRHLVGGGAITDHHYGMLEQGLQVAWWGCLALALMRADRGGSSRILGGAWRVLAAVALGHVVLFALLRDNPLWRHISVGSWPGFDLVTLTYGLPVLLAAAIAHEAGRQRAPGVQRLGGIAAIVLAWAFVTLTVRHAFQGPFLDGPAPGDAEWYAYSALWLAYGGGLLALGVRLDVPALRSASMIVIVATVLKVFIFDMSTLAGLLRVASFLGLGLALVLIGWLHQTALNALAAKQPPP